MTRDHATTTIRAFLDVSLNATGYPVTIEPEPGKTGDWRFRVLPADAWSFLKPSGHITWSGTEWRKPAANTQADRAHAASGPADVNMETVKPSPPAAKTNPVRPTEAELRAIVSNFLRTQNMAGFEFTLHNITDNSADFRGPEGGNPVRPVWSGRIVWRNVIRVRGRALVDYDAEFDKHASPVPDLTADDLGPFYAAKVKAEAAHADHVASLERAHRANMDRFDAAMKQSDTGPASKPVDPTKRDAWAPQSEPAMHHLRPLADEDIGRLRAAGREARDAMMTKIRSVSGLAPRDNLDEAIGGFVWIYRLLAERYSAFDALRPHIEPFDQTVAALLSCFRKSLFPSDDWSGHNLTTNAMLATANLEERLVWLIESRAKGSRRLVMKYL